MLEIELARLDPEQVAGRPRDEPRLVRRRRASTLRSRETWLRSAWSAELDALLGEQLLDQPLARDDAVRAQQQQREQRALLRPADRDGDAVDAEP